MIYPTVHLNGTSKDALLDPIGEVMGSLVTAINSMPTISPNARDYNGDFNRAASEHADRIRRLNEIYSELDALWLNIEGQSCAQ